MSETAHFRSDAKAYENGKHVGPGDWLSLIHEVNRIAAEEGVPVAPGGTEQAPIFGSPDSTGDWWAGGYVEEYRDARVLHRDDESVSVIAKTELGDRLIRAAAAAKGWTVH